MIRIKDICLECDLCMRRRNIVYGAGNEDAFLMILGEAPGYHEDKQAIPFIGHSGIMLTNVLRQAGFNRDKLYITNTVKCRPSNNETPNDTWIVACRPLLSLELDIVKPRIILALGNTALRVLSCGTISGITKYRGKVLRLPRHNSENIHCLSTYHPSAVLRNEELKVDFIKDIKLLVSLYRDVVFRGHESEL